MSLLAPLSTPNPNRIFGLDVLRAFAIVTVMVGHSAGLVGNAWRPYYELLWFDGVAIFFVLSGFLIGRVLLKTLHDRAASWPVFFHFMGRRWLRTIPAYVAVLSVLFLLQSGNPTFRLTYY